MTKGRRRMQDKQHYLISLTTQSGVILHSYLVTEGRKYVNAMAEKLVEMAEQEGFTVMVPLILSTTLEASGIKIVEDVLRANEAVPDIDERLKVDDYIFAVFTLSNAASQPLMDLH